METEAENPYFQLSAWGFLALTVREKNRGWDGFSRHKPHLSGLQSHNHLGSYSRPKPSLIFKVGYWRGPWERGCGVKCDRKVECHEFGW